MTAKYERNMVLEAGTLGAASTTGRGGRDRTGDLLLPKQARYRCATPRS